MESSEDDAGTATSASRRESAREKDLGRLEDVDATSSIQQDTSELRTSCQTPAMSEDNFDGDSVPSPSTHDVNTSTEAILDMIDEIVDGPGAPKRLPLLLDTDAENAPTSCEQQNEQALESATPEPELGLSTSSIIKNHNSEVENVESDTKCTSKTQNEDISMQSNPCDSVKNSHTDDVNINIKHQSPEISANPKHGLSDNCESFASDKSCLSEVSETGARVKSNTESVACVSTEVGQSSCTENVTVCATVPSVAPLCSKNIRSSNIRSVERNIESPINIENHVNISELQLESITCVSTNNVESSNGDHLESARHCLQKEVERTEILSNSCSISGDDRESSQIESEGNLKCKNTVTSPNIVLAASNCESSDKVESSSNLEILSTDHNISSVPLSKSVDCGTNDSPIKIDIESSRTSKNAPVLEQSKRSETEPSSASNLASKTSCDNNSNNECVPGSGTRNTQVIENSETSLNIENISENTSNSESTIALDPAVSKAGLSLENLEDTIKTVVSNIQQATSSKSLSSPMPSIPSSSVTRTEGSISMEAMNDRLKCVTTCEKKDIVVVESAESTSSDCSASEVKSYSVESMSRIPLRRRLVRPALSRPDSTVSSTVDSSITPHTSEHSSECIKDVSSSSDAVTTVQDSDNTEDIRSVSEISICKAETSTSPHKKIRLIRRKNDPQLNSTPFESLIRESKECESTSSCEEKLTVTSEQVPSVSVSSHIKENLDYKSSPDITDHLENSNDSPTPSSSLKNPELIRYPDNKEHERVPPLKLHIPNENKVLEKLQSHEHSKGERSSYNIELKEEKLDESERIVPKLTIKVNNTPCDKPDLKSPIPKLTIKPVKVPISEENDRISEDKVFKANITKLNIKPILKPPEKINEIHRKSSSSEISESEYSENDDSTSTSDPPSANEQGPLDVVPKVTIKLGKPGTDSEGKFYTESNIPKLTIKGIQNSNEEGRESPSKLKLVVCQSEEKQMEKVPKLTIKSVSISEGQPLSPKLTIKPLKPPDGLNRDIIYEDNPPIPKLIISTDSSHSDQKDQSHVHKVTIKPITKPDTEAFSKTPKKTMPENLENIPVITKLNIKPVIKPDNNLEVCNKIDEKVPIVSKINIKPIIKPIEVDFSKEDNIPKITKLNIKPIKSPDGNSSRDTDCQEDTIEETKPIITKLNIKPILKPKDEDISKESENHSSENSSDDNNDNIPIVTKINIKPICRPTELEETEPCNASKDENIPIVPKLIIKPLVKPDQPGPQSPKKERTSSPDLRNQNIPLVTKLNIKPIVKPDENQLKLEDGEDVKNPPLLMKINRKTRSDSGSDTQYHIDKGMDQYNNIHHNIPIISKLNVKPNFIETKSVCNAHESLEQSNYAQNDNQHDKQDLVSIGTLGEVKPAPVRQANQPDLKLNHKGDIENNFEETSNRVPSTTLTKELNEDSKDSKSFSDKTDVTFNYQISNIQKPVMEEEKQLRQKSQPSNTNCTLLKKLLENRKYDNSSLNSDSSPNTSNSILPVQTGHTPSNDCTKHEIIDLCNSNDDERESSPAQLKIRSMQDLCNEVSESVTKPLEISISDKINQCSDQDSPRIILKINKTDHGASAKIITDEIINKNETKGVSPTDSMMTNRRRPILLGRKKQESESANVSEGKKLRSSRIVQSPEKSSFPKKNTGKRPSNLDSSTGPPSPKEAELSVLDSKRLKLGQLLSSKTLTITPVVVSKTGPITPTDSLEIRQAKINHSLLNNENCSKNGSSKLHNILSNLQAKQQLKVMPLNDLHSERKHSESPELKSGGTSLDSNPNIQVESEPLHQNCDEIRDTLFQESAESRDYNITPDPLSRDPLEVVTLKGSPDITAEDAVKIPSIVEMTPQPKKRGRPRKLPVSEGAKPLVLPTPALEERPQRSLRLSRDRPVLIVKPRGRGRGRGRRMDPEQTPPQEAGVVDTANKFFDEKTEEIDPTSSRIKLPRMTEALDKMPSTCATPLTGRRRTSSSSTSDMPFYNTDTPEFKMVDTSLLRMEDPFAKSPEMLGRGGRGGRGSRGRGRATPRTPRGRGRGRGGGRGAMYMKETMGIYGRVCGPATTTVQLFEEETCMMDDNATPAKPSHLLDEDSQSSVKSSTNESSKAKKSKFADLFDSNKVWSASDVKEYTWPPPENRDASEHQVMMIQEQVAMFLGVKSFKRRYPELKRRAISAAERDYVLSKGIVTEALCDLGITAVDASEVLDIMLSDYPHKYEEYRSYQREKQLSDPTPEPVAKEPREIRMDRASDKPEPPKVDPEKTRLIMAAAAIASASEWNARMNALRRPACVDLQSLTIQRRRAPTPSNPQIRVTPPHGFYPHALLPGQYQHTYRAYTSEQLRYFPLNTVVAAAPAPPSPQVSSSESEPDWSHASSSDSEDTHRMHKRKKLTKVKRSSETEVNPPRVEEPEVDTCRTCKLRLEANRKTTHERFLVCATCNAKLHPGCVDLQPDTIRKCREYAWQCNECKTCCSCSRPADAKMMFCDLCDRGHHLYCLGLQRVPDGRWHCAECAICKSCGGRSPGGPPAPGSDPSSGPQGSLTEPGGPHWHHQTRRGPGGHKVYSHSLCTPCASKTKRGKANP
ncbi:uncharacterized protein LOC125051751 isoform X2 [Pieris napi]|uniref:uncharacterized protein LOC125051751 isoform X2 n=1 Tax=Pieris napi TaxID=78633 RepID=UPI001FBC128A|nr:uncharacterized protein LOC125051751 isoform X2 [Pieris napi]XP_047508248.1 uncharacterized protein LOC125051751 isoform X2 [Pieris napi]XP_047508249.1 uncharacterized protein LOC125051751 isoform X2 [Pieris napi]